MSGRPLDTPNPEPNAAVVRQLEIVRFREATHALPCEVEGELARHGAR